MKSSRFSPVIARKPDTFGIPGEQFRCSIAGIARFVEAQLPAERSSHCKGSGRSFSRDGAPARSGRIPQRYVEFQSGGTSSTQSLETNGGKTWQS
jgi:hypothetical protein